MNDTLSIAVASHKPYWMPSDPAYLPFQVGASFHDPIEGFQPDNTLVNIGERNPHYSELTALYWMWKNSDAAYKGIVHYRRYFKGSGEKDIMTGDEARALLEQAPIILPKQRNYFIENHRDHYGHTFSYEQLDLVEELLRTYDPDAAELWASHLQETKGHMFNMMVMRADMLDAYCAWLFPLLDFIDERLDYDAMTPFEARAVGRLSELLLDVWVAKSGAEYVERAVISTEPVNWLKKGSGFLSAKFFGKKYEKSF